MIKLYADLVNRIALNSDCIRLQVGALIVKNDNILSFGWNGSPSGWDNCCEKKVYASGGGWLDVDDIEAMFPYTDDTNRYKLVTLPEVLHAESNCLSKLAKSHESSNGAAMFLTHQPCLHCAKMIYQAGITHVYYLNEYRDNAGVEFLNECDVKVEFI